MVLPSITDALIVAILLVPGFVAFFIIRRIGIIDKTLSDFEGIVWSVFFTLIILIPFAAITGLDNLDKIRDEIFLPKNTLVLLGLTIGGGIVSGLIVKQFRRRYQHGDPWEKIVEHYANGGSWITVMTSTGREYGGKYRMAGISEDKREIIISKPVEVIRDNTGAVLNEIDWGEELVFTEGDISRVVFYRTW